MMGAPAALKLSTRLAMWSVELAPPAWGFGLARFSSMDRATAEQYLLRWDRSPRYPIRSLFFALKVIVMGMAYDTPEIARDYCGGRV
ncbi:MAG: hypothetical protein HY303_13850 [Candidatus Wallbacteria bacterium]|nr:hypothetical protein [Candidatus Wallbacteria bacterium]